MRIPSPRLAAALGIALLLAGCVTRAVDVRPVAANPADFAAWDCTRIDDESDRLQQRAADLAYAVDERGGNNIVALGVGITVFWPALLAMMPEGPETAELARLRGRYDALRSAADAKACPPPSVELPAARAAGLPVAVGERLVYEERAQGRGQPTEVVLELLALRRDEFEFRLGDQAAWRQDPAGNVLAAPRGMLQWVRLLRRDLELGQVLAGEISYGDYTVQARVRGQVVAVGPQWVAQRRFDAVVIDLFGDARRGDISTRLDGAMVVDRASGVLLRLDLRSAHGEFSLQRRLARVEPAPPR